MPLIKYLVCWHWNSKLDMLILIQHTDTILTVTVREGWGRFLSCQLDQTFKVWYTYQRLLMQSKERAHKNQHAGLWVGLYLFFNQLLMSVVKGLGRGPQIEGLGWMPLPFPHQTSMQWSKTNCVCAPPARPAEIVFAHNFPPFVLICLEQEMIRV